MNHRKLLNQTVQNTPPSGIRRFFDVANEIEGCISLGLGEPNFVTPLHVRQAAVESLMAGRTSYTSSEGLLELRRLLSRYYSERFGVSYDCHKQALVTIGASEAIDVALRALLNPGDEVLIPDPAYTSYVPCVQFAGGVPVLISTKAEEGFILSREAIQNAITPKTKAIIVPYPNNPTGATMTREQLSDALQAIQGSDIYVISDEIYAELSYGGQEHCAVASLPGMFERTITLNGFSKAFAMTGWRLGYALAPAPIISQMMKIHQLTLLCGNITTQDAAIAALKQGFVDHFADVAAMREEYDRKRRFIVPALNDMGLSCFEPKGAFYAFPSIRSTGLSSEDFAERLLMEAKVAVIPGSGFGPGGEGHVRISYAYAMEHVQEAMQRIRGFLKNNGWCAEGLEPV